MKKSFKKNTTKTKKKFKNSQMHKITRTKSRTKTESQKWKRHILKYKRIKKRKKILSIIIIFLLTIAIILGYVYFFKIDTDGDGLPDTIDDDDDNDDIPDYWEEYYGLNPKKRADAEYDKDGDGLTNKNEYYFHSNPLIIDSDYDDLNDWDEWNVRKIYGRSTDPTNPDTDGDGMPDGWEMKYDLNPILNDADLDTDKDGYDANRNGILEREEYYTNLEEFGNKTNPKSRDSDDDSMWDGWEVYYRDKCSIIKRKFQQYNPTSKREYNHTFNPNDPADSNNDIDVVINQNSTLRFAPDGLINLQEFLNDTNPTKPDTDGDSLTDYEEIEVYKTDPLHWDTDGDGLWDGWEIKYGGKSVGLDPNSKDTDGDKITDDFEDLDNDDLQNKIEHLPAIGTSPVLWDTDGDGMPDGWEVVNSCLDPLIPNAGQDIDLDLISNLEEFENGTDPCEQDTDGDGLTDTQELVTGFHGIIIKGRYIVNSNVPRYFTNATRYDTDGDGLNDSDEIFIYKTNASNVDTDGDGITDNEEIISGEDGFVTNPRNVDTDNDRLNDRLEIFSWGTKPTVADTDGDGLIDGEEVLVDYKPFSSGLDTTDPKNPDTDGDGMTDGWEAHHGFASRDIKLPNKNKTVIESYDQRYGTNYYQQLLKNSSIAGVWLVNPLRNEDKFEDADFDGYDSTGDGKIDEFEEYNNSEEFENQTYPVDWDTDDDGMSDGWEWNYYGRAPVLNVEGPDPKVQDGHLDNDGDGIHYYINRKRYKDNFTNLEEYLMGEDLNNDGIIDHDTTDPNRPDTDRDGQSDYDEIWNGDDDGDGLWNGWELIFNGTPLDSGGYIPYRPMPGKFNPTKKNSDDVDESDKWEDYDGDGFSNIDEQGDIWHSPGSSDPTDQSMTPDTIIIGSRSVVSTNKENVITTYKFENELFLFFHLEISKNYTKAFYEINLLAKYITQMNNYNQLKYALSTVTEKSKLNPSYLFNIIMLEGNIKNISRLSSCGNSKLKVRIR